MGFTPKNEGPTSDLPFRERSRYLDSSSLLTDDRSDGAALVVPATIRAQIEALVGRARPRETAGLLGGQCFQDTLGRWTLVTSAAGDSTIGRLGQVELSPAEKSQLRDAIHRDDPAADIIGWFHSHPGPSGFSYVDREEQTQWGSTQIGLLVFMAYDGAGWCRAYEGPDSAELNLSGSTTPAKSILASVGAGSRSRHDATRNRDTVRFAKPERAPSQQPAAAKEPLWQRPTRPRQPGGQSPDNPELGTSELELLITMTIITATALLLLGYYVT